MSNLEDVLILATGKNRRPLGLAVLGKPAMFSRCTGKVLRSGLLLTMLLCGFLTVLGGCAGNGTTGVVDANGMVEGLEGSRLRVLEAALAQIGRPYRYGGASPQQGFDCSGLVQYSYNSAGIRVPRTTAQQRRASAPVALASLRPGDLVFFRIALKARHVGIYAGDGNFVHSPSSGGKVRVEQIDNPYWSKRLLGGGTFLGG